MPHAIPSFPALRPRRVAVAVGPAVPATMLPVARQAASLAPFTPREMATKRGVDLRLALPALSAAALGAHPDGLTTDHERR